MTTGASTILVMARRLGSDDIDSDDRGKRATQGKES
jgi:hypothetical protein